MTALALSGLATPLRKSRHQRTDRARCLSTRRTRYSSSGVERRLSSRLLQGSTRRRTLCGAHISTTLASPAQLRLKPWPGRGRVYLSRFSRFRCWCFLPSQYFEAGIWQLLGMLNCDCSATCFNHYSVWGGLPITFSSFFLKAAIFIIVELVLASHFTMLLLQKREFLPHMPLRVGHNIPWQE